MSSRLASRNPYVAGKAIGEGHNFFGREDVFRLVETVLSSPDQNAIVLFGQRRIGKTSILLQLCYRLPSPSFKPIYFDLMNRARKPLGTVLYELATTMAGEFNLLQPGATDFMPMGEHFRDKFLPVLYQNLGEDIRPVILFDEFDVLDVAAEEQLPPTAAARTFFPYLRHLMETEPRLAFVIVVGRKAEDLSIDVKATFKAARYQRISLLDDDNARQLVGLAERQGSLCFTAPAVDRLLNLTARHPYLTQLMCQLLFDRAYAAFPTDTPTVNVTDVDAVIPKGLEVGENVFEWIWDGLPPAERVIFSAIAGATADKALITEDELTTILQHHGIRILIRELELAPKTLIDWEMLRRAEGGYSSFIELMRRWVAERKPFPKVKDELDHVNPIADQQYQLGHTYYRLGKLAEAITPLQAALQANPNHLKARLLLGDALPGTGELLGPKLLVLFGDHRDRFPAPQNVRELVGTCPVTIQTGKKKVVRFRRACDHADRNTLQQFAIASVPQSEWAAAYYAACRTRGLSKNQAYRSLANRWVGIIWKLWQTGTLYNEGYHLQQIHLYRRSRLQDRLLRFNGLTVATRA